MLFIYIQIRGGNCIYKNRLWMWMHQCKERSRVLKALLTYLVDIGTLGALAVLMEQEQDTSPCPFDIGHYSSGITWQVLYHHTSEGRSSVYWPHVYSIAPKTTQCRVISKWGLNKVKSQLYKRFMPFIISVYLWENAVVGQWRGGNEGFFFFFKQ